VLGAVEGCRPDLRHARLRAIKRRQRVHLRRPRPRRTHARPGGRPTRPARQTGSPHRNRLGVPAGRRARRLRYCLLPGTRRRPHSVAPNLPLSEQAERRISAGCRRLHGKKRASRPRQCWRSRFHPERSDSWPRPEALARNRRPQMCGASGGRMQRRRQRVPVPAASTLGVRAAGLRDVARLTVWSWHMMPLRL
jgi:hypothetical protein